MRAEACEVDFPLWCHGQTSELSKWLLLLDGIMWRQGKDAKPSLKKTRYWVVQKRWRLTALSIHLGTYLCDRYQYTWERIYMTSQPLTASLRQPYARFCL